MYLIGGSPRTGKTLLAKRLAKRLGIGWLSLDTVRFVLRDLVPEVTQLDNFGKPPGPWADLFYPYVRDAVLSSAYVAEDYIIEGVDFMPRHVRNLSAETPVTACFLGLSTVDMSTIDAHAGRMDYQKHLDQAVRDGYPAWIVRWTEEVRRECAETGIPFFDLAGDYEAQAGRALDTLAST